MSTVQARPVPEHDASTLLREITLSRVVALQLAFVGTLGFVLSLGVFSRVFELVTGQSLVSVNQFVSVGR